MYKKILLLFVIILISGCGYIVPTPAQRFTTLKKLIDHHDVQSEVLSAKKFDLYSVHSNLSQCENSFVSIYIEGDGLPWITIDTISQDPTPIDPLGLKLFLQDTNQCKVYLARPCQYVRNSSCVQSIWTNRRFSENVIESFNQVLDEIKKRSGASSFKLFGYSGGGAIAALLAARRDDISRLVTIGGNLDTAYWTKEHYISPLSGSLNPADFSQKLKKIKQIHLVGEDDTIVGFSVLKSYCKRFEDKRNIRYKIYKKFNHHCCWKRYWKNILSDLDKKGTNTFELCK